MGRRSRLLEDDESIPRSDSTSDSESCVSDDEDMDMDRSKARKHAGLIDASTRFEETLKYNKKEAREGEAAMQAEDRHPCVQFEHTVTGIEIRHHRDYPACDRKLMWNSFAEIQANADRNINEFRHDGWQWRNATEESEMVVQSVGELVHPASYKSRKAAPKRKGRKKTRVHRRKGRQYSRG
ncbi:expressed unknown protein [Seminavis robusta]|uniref:Uncharacterized protein n=1 Tax=Seminavis robusta TaxID=568900 RepID=A0A9N8E3C4_9STRA|nr:expressed unknown protein [Seminavis robusta]|eukprot:Sro483_g152150.1 n/a (182) ;mRNA; f:58144-58689